MECDGECYQRFTFAQGKSCAAMGVSSWEQGSRAQDVSVSPLPFPCACCESQWPLSPLGVSSLRAALQITISLHQNETGTGRAGGDLDLAEYRDEDVLVCGWAGYPASKLQHLNCLG